MPRTIELDTHRQWIADRIHQLRLERGLTQTQLAMALNTAQGTVGKWEAGIRIPNLISGVRLARVFGVTVEKLLEGVE
jgi:transcriptional regulator with XRE-family HTH domain